MRQTAAMAAAVIVVPLHGRRRASPCASGRADRFPASPGVAATGPTIVDGAYDRPIHR
jgi:hypothetical protein